ncbi:MAG TPA: DegT/DnrJ/EryC1/StrS family aminotransferase [Dehalococcoidia bacterium]|nr:DegT/DnrJ/EryC1/StrS family aminotransferase [Dehalococcoidia bacterium]
MERIPFVDLAAQQRRIAAEVEHAIAAVLSRCDFVLGQDVGAFEAEFARYLDVGHAVGVSNGLDALRLALLALDIGPGDEVIVPANTYIATALAVSSVGARPVLIDCEPGTYTLDPRLLPAALTPRTRAIIPVHLAGQAADMDPILGIARSAGVAVIEDAAQAHGTRYQGRGCGSLGDIGCFSFYPSKNLGAYGDGGAVTTGDAYLAERIRRLRDNGQTAKYVHVEPGLNARLDTLQAAILRVKLPHLDAWNGERAAHAAAYRRQLADVGDLALPVCATWSTHIYHLFIVETERRDALQQHLTDAGIATGIHYPVPIHLQEAYAALGGHAGDFPNAERAARRMLSLPMYPELSDAQIARTCAAVRSFFETAAQPEAARRPHGQEGAAPRRPSSLPARV